MRTKGTDPREAPCAAYTLTTDQKKNRENQTVPSPGRQRKAPCCQGHSQRLRNEQSKGLVSFQPGSRYHLVDLEGLSVPEEENLGQLVITQPALECCGGATVGSRVMQMTPRGCRLWWDGGAGEQGAPDQDNKGKLSPAIKGNCIWWRHD